MDYVVNPESIAAVEPFTIQAGKRYNRADGGISGVLIKDTLDVNPTGAYDPKHNKSYLPNGKPFHPTIDWCDLISEYIEPTAKDAAMLGIGFYKRMPDGTTKYLRPEDVVMVKNVDPEPTAEPQDEWGPWIGWNGGECPVVGDTIIDCIYKYGGKLFANMDLAYKIFRAATEIDATIIAYRIKKEPEVYADAVWINTIGLVTKHSAGSTFRRAIITLTNGEPSIRWADE